MAIGIIGLLGSFVSAAGTIMSAGAQASALNYQAQVAKQQGMQQVAAAQRQELEQNRKTQIAQSTLQAQAAASGAGASDPTIVSLSSNIAGRGTYMGLLDLWQGQAQQWEYDTKAQAYEAQASAIQSSAPFSALGTILGGVGGMVRSNAMVQNGYDPSLSGFGFGAGYGSTDYWSNIGVG